MPIINTKSRSLILYAETYLRDIYYHIIKITAKIIINVVPMPEKKMASKHTCATRNPALGL
jgi:hypothetical protein